MSGFGWELISNFLVDRALLGVISGYVCHDADRAMVCVGRQLAFWRLKRG